MECNRTNGKEIINTCNRLNVIAQRPGGDYQPGQRTPGTDERWMELWNHHGTTRRRRPEPVRKWKSLDRSVQKSFLLSERSRAPEWVG